MESTSEVVARWERTIVVIVGICLLGLAGFGGRTYYKSHVQKQWRQHVELLILRLAPKRPANVTPEQWAVCLLQTWQLHANNGDSSFPERQREPFARDFERLLDDSVTLNTIDTIWDEYVRRDPGAKGFLKYRPTTPKMQEGAEKMVNEVPSMSLDAWLKMLDERERKRQ